MALPSPPAGAPPGVVGAVDLGQGHVETKSFPHPKSRPLELISYGSDLFHPNTNPFFVSGFASWRVSFRKEAGGRIPFLEIFIFGFFFIFMNLCF